MLKQLKIKQILILLPIGVAFSCGNAEWDKADKNALLDRCEQEGGTSSYCKCYLKNAMEKFPNAEDTEEIDFETAVELSLGCE